MARTEVERAYPTTVNGATPAVRIKHIPVRRSRRVAFGRVVRVLDAVQWGLLPLAATVVSASIVRQAAVTPNDLVPAFAGSVVVVFAILTSRTPRT